MKTVIIVVAALAVIVGGAFALKGNHKSNNSGSDNSPSQAAANVAGSSNQASGSDQNSAATITYTNNGFSPAVLTVKAGTVVTIKNDSSIELQFSSDPHPTHTDDPELNLDVIEPGQSQTLKVTVTGNHGYHNHLEPGDTGHLIVQ